MMRVISTPVAVASFPTEITPAIVRVVDRSFDAVNNHKTTLALLKAEQAWLAAYVAAKFVGLRDNLAWQKFTEEEFLQALDDEIRREEDGDYESQGSSETEDVY